MHIYGNRGGWGEEGGRDRICFVNKANRCYENPWWKQSYGYCRDREYQTVETLSLFSVKSGTIKRKTATCCQQFESEAELERVGDGGGVGGWDICMHTYTYMHI